MANVGRPPKPTRLKVLEGNPGKRPFNLREPQPTPEAPSCPAWLEREARREWRRLARELGRLGLLTVVDRAVLAGYCQAYARWRQAEEVLTAEGLTFETPNGYLQQRPEVAIAQRYLRLMARLAAEFGLSPSSRSRLSTPEPVEDDLDAILA